MEEEKRKKGKQNTARGKEGNMLNNNNKLNIFNNFHSRKYVIKTAKTENGSMNFRRQR